MGLTWPFLHMFGSHDMRHTSFRKLMVVNETPRVWGVTEEEERELEERKEKK